MIQLVTIYSPKFLHTQKTIETKVILIANALVIIGLMLILIVAVVVVIIIIIIIIIIFVPSVV